MYRTYAFDCCVGIDYIGFWKVSDQQILFDSEPEIEHEDQQHNTQLLNKI